MGVGLRCFIAGAHLALGPKYRRFIVWPALLSLLIVVAGIVLTFGYIGSFSAYLRDLGIWPGIIDWLIKPLIYLFGILINVYLFSFLAVIIGAPWYSVLNERVDPPPSQRTTRWYKEIFPSLQRELIKLRYTLPRLLCLWYDVRNALLSGSNGACTGTTGRGTTANGSLQRVTGNRPPPPNPTLVS